MSNIKSRLYKIFIFFFLLKKIFSYDLESNFDQFFKNKQIYIFKDFPEFLVLENEYLNSYPKTNYVFELLDSDFIICKVNPKYPTLPQKKNDKIPYKNLQFSDLGQFNNYFIEKFLTTKNYKETITGLEEGYRLDPLFFAFLYNLGRLHYLQKEYSESIFFFKKVLYYFPNYPRVHYHLGSNYYFLNDEILGEYHFRRAIQLEPEQIQYLVDFILILTQKKQFSKAKLYSSYGEKKFGDHPFFLMFKIKQLTKEKKFKEALQILNQIQTASLDEFQRLELKYVKFQFLEQIQDLENAYKEIEEIIQTNNTKFFNQYPMEDLIQEKRRLKKIIETYKY